MKDIFFSPEEWDIDTNAHATIASIKTCTGYNKKPIQGWQMGDWLYSWSTIYAILTLEPGEVYTFHFWLNGGENAHHDEICELEIFGEDWNARQTFGLNRNHTKPVKYVNGWYLYSIPFTAPDEFVTLRFNVQKAIATIVPATQTDLYLCDHIPSDQEDSTKLQRSNIVFPKGWPDDEASDTIDFTIGDRTFSINRHHLILGGGIACAIIVTLILKKRKK